MSPIVAPFLFNIKGFGSLSGVIASGAEMEPTQLPLISPQDDQGEAVSRRPHIYDPAKQHPRFPAANRGELRTPRNDL